MRVLAEPAGQQLLLRLSISTYGEFGEFLGGAEPPPPPSPRRDGKKWVRVLDKWVVSGEEENAREMDVRLRVAPFAF